MTSMATERQNYLTKLGLDEDPFVSDQHNAIFLSKELLRVREKLNHLVHFGNLLLLVLGEKGSGKSTLVQYFHNTQDKDVDCCVLAASKSVTTRDIFNKVRSCFALPEDEDNPVETVSSFQQILTHSASDVHRVLIIDSAEQLLPEVLLQIAQLTIEQRKLVEPVLTILLVADITLNNIVTDTVFKDLGDEGVHKIELKGIKKDELDEFIAFFCQKSPLKKSPFNEYQIKEIIANGRGNPGRIKLECSQQLKNVAFSDEDFSEDMLDVTDEVDMDAPDALEPIDDEREPLVPLAVEGASVEDASEEDAIETKSSTLKVILLFAFVVLATGLVTIGYQFFAASSDVIVVESVPSSETAADDKREAQAIIPESQQGNSEEAQLEQESATVESGEEINGATALAEESTDPEEAEAKEENAVTLSESEEPKQQSPEVEVVAVQSEKTKPTSTTPAVETIKLNESAKQANGNIQGGADEPLKAAKDTSSEANTRPEKKQTNDPNALTLESFSDYAKSGLTLQIAGFSSLEAVEAFLKRYPDLAALKYYERRLNGKQSFVIVHGKYRNRDEANNAKSSLPAAIQKSKPWIKSFAAIKREMIKTE